jgi:CheY-like chemotaxis protein
MASTNRILIADDNEPNRELLEAYLATTDCE